MRNFIVTDAGFLGFGATKEEAQEDVYLNKCVADLRNDDKGLFKERRAQLKPWLPQSNMIHIAGVGCLVYEHGKITNTKTGKIVDVLQYRHSIYQYLINLVGERLSYTDIAIVIRPELDEFFKNISPNFVSIKDMPVIKLLGSINGFEPDVVYILDCDIVVGFTDTMVGIKVVGDELFHVAEIPDGLYMMPLLAYIGCRMGYIFNAEGVKPYGEEVDES